MIGRLLKAAAEKLSGFSKASSGNVAITFALAALPVIGGVGAAVDYSHANSVKVALQAALDSTALMLSKEAVNDTSSELQTNALKYFKAMFTRPEGTNIAISATYTTAGGSTVVVSGSVDVPTVFMGIMGYNQLTVRGTSTSSWGTTRMWVALALDNTGSMADAGKMTALKSATKSLLTQLQAAASQNGDVYVSIIPFSKDVNVGTAYKDQDWIDWSMFDGGGTCTASSSNELLNLLAGLITDPDTCKKYKYKWTPNKSKWNGCITDRINNPIPDNSTDYDQSAYPPDASLSDSLFPAENYTSCPAAMTGLTYDWAALNKLTNSMQPNGNTNQPIGLVWGWQSLVGGGPFTIPAQSSLYTYQKYIILLSDGLNTEDRFSGSQADVDSRMYDSTGAGTCANIKASGITIYAIQVNTGGDPTSTLLRNCASKASNFYEIKQADQIAAVFTDIGTGMTQLRLAK
ncbi:MAG: pilus assembly protein TadG-related protein [Sphingomicrobium sp.]